MDIKTTPPDVYAQWLRDHGVPDREIEERMAHDALRALRGQFGELGVPAGYEQIANDLSALLSADAMARALR